MSHVSYLILFLTALILILITRLKSPSAFMPICLSVVLTLVILCWTLLPAVVLYLLLHTHCLCALPGSK